MFIFSGNIHKWPHLLVLPPVDSRDNISIKVLSHKAEWVFVRKKRKQRNRNCSDLESALLFDLSQTTLREGLNEEATTASVTAAVLQYPGNARGTAGTS